MSDAPVRLYFPVQRGPRWQPCLMLGWTLPVPGQYAVAVLLPLDKIEDDSDRFCNVKWPKIMASCPGLTVLGSTTCDDRRNLPTTTLKELLADGMKGQPWLHVETSKRGVPLRVFQNDSNHCLEFEVILYRQPRTRALQYLSIQPLVLDLSVAVDPEILRKKHMNRRPSVSSHITTPVQRGLENKFLLHAKPFVGAAQPLPPEHLNEILAKINSTYSTQRTVMSVMRLRRFHHKFGDWAQRLLAKGAEALRLILRPMMLLVFALRVLAEISISFLNAKLPNSKIALKDISNAAQQVDLRLQQACYWPWQYVSWRLSKNKLSSLCQAQYIGFYNTVWLIANDVIMGVALGAFIANSAEPLSVLFLQSLDYYTIDGISSIIDWLMGSPPPVGLKLNRELNSFLGELFLWLLHLWKEAVLPIRINLPDIIILIGLSGSLGASMIISLISDLLSVTTLHLYIFYAVAAKIYNWQVSLILSLFTLFRGKKLNVLRNRVDSAEFDLDQLLIGTILFTVLVFLFPTVAVYYVLFSLARVMVVTAQSTFEIALAVLNHFPLFAIMLRFKDPGRLPEGLRFTIVDEAHANSSYLTRIMNCLWPPFVSETVFEEDSTLILLMENVPIGMSAIFYQYAYLLKSLRINYLTAVATRSLFTGKRIKRIPRLEYPTLPKRGSPKTIDIGALWRFFNEVELG